jgi:phytoene dehydrogenase-like protein
MLPSVTKANYVRGYLIEIKFNDAMKKVIDFKPWLSGPIFKSLNSKAYFKRFFIDGQPWRGQTVPTSHRKRFIRQRRSSKLASLVFAGGALTPPITKGMLHALLELQYKVPHPKGGA